MKRRLLLTVLAAGFCLGALAAPRVTRAMLAVVETSFNNRVMRFSVDDPIDVLGYARAVYLDGFGVVMSAEVDLLPGSNITPFRQQFTKEEKEKIRVKKLERVGKIKEIMRETLVDTAAALDTVPAEEQIALSVHVFRKSLEDSTGIPGQIVMQAPKKALIAYKTSGGKGPLDAIVKTQEF